MSRLQEFREVMNQIKTAWQDGQKTALLMLMNVQGSAYRLPGTKVMMAEDGRIFGTISGGCLESDLFGWAEKAMQTGEPRLQRYDLSESEVWSLGIGCKGSLTIGILPVDPQDRFWLQVDEALQREESVSLIIEIMNGARALLKEDGTVTGERDFLPEEVLHHAKQRFACQTRAEVFVFAGRRFYIDVVKPSERLVVAGAGLDARPVVEMASRMGFSVTVLDPRSGFNTPEAFPAARHVIQSASEVEPASLTNSWWVIMNHHLERDQASLDLALRSKPKFIGVLGPMTRTEEMLVQIDRKLSSGPIHAPIGLDLGAETMDEVAMSIVSQLMAERNSRQALPLHGKSKIHA
ncbi:XdhC family protein [Brevibacillus choshinensis]|uniref:XdhC family protein n=1 Tax=Brevibacillus choshinensis TaxID=54911 RepID=UPI002E1D1681|nr:XdhC family protein [Brevibacillus choshinensis]MED4754939.1 XdhC family protein [Brevibacillus choshinensis]MED4783619.1 XdhC family protein [Brevibacillus choshinensis]